MKKSLLRTIMLWFTILTLLWSSQGPSYVWCVTADGPTHLESALDSHCNQGETDACVATFGDETNSSPCVDLAANHDTLQYRTVSDCDLGASFLLSTIIRPEWAPFALVRSLSSNLILEPPPRITTILLIHRSTVLLI